MNKYVSLIGLEPGLVLRFHVLGKLTNTHLKTVIKAGTSKDPLSKFSIVVHFLTTISVLTATSPKLIDFIMSSTIHSIK